MVEKRALIMVEEGAGRELESWWWKGLEESLSHGGGEGFIHSFMYFAKISPIKRCTVSVRVGGL